MTRPWILLLLSSLMAGCSLDIESIQNSAEELKKNVESSNLKDCKDEDGKPLPEWVCRKGSPENANTEP